MAFQFPLKIISLYNLGYDLVKTVSLLKGKYQEGERKDPD